MAGRGGAAILPGSGGGGDEGRLSGGIVAVARTWLALGWKAGLGPGVDWLLWSVNGDKQTFVLGNPRRQVATRCGHSVEHRPWLHLADTGLSAFRPTPYDR